MNAVVIWVVRDSGKSPPVQIFPFQPGVLVSDNKPSHKTYVMWRGAEGGCLTLILPVEPEQGIARGYHLPVCAAPPATQGA